MCAVEDGDLDVVALLDELRDAGFDLRRTAHVTYLLGTGLDRQTAYAMRDAAVRGTWQAALYADETGWVVRIGRSHALQPHVLLQVRRRVRDLADEHGAAVLGFAVEDLSPDGSWDALAEQLAREVAGTGVVVPAQRRPAERPSTRAPLRPSA